MMPRAGVIMEGNAGFCSGCGAGNPSGARFCTSCGRSLEAAETTCPACSTQLPPASRFCFNCGHELAGGATRNLPGRPARQVTAGIADQLRASGPGERRRITLLFCDVQDSTALAERLDPEEWATIMRGALSRFIAPVERYGGTVARILGDAILAYFGAPVSHEDDPQRAVLAGLGIIEACRDLVDDVQRRFGLPFGVRVASTPGWLWSAMSAAPCTGSTPHSGMLPTLPPGWSRPPAPGRCGSPSRRTGWSRRSSTSCRSGRSR